MSEHCCLSCDYKDAMASQEPCYTCSRAPFWSNWALRSGNTEPQSGPRYQRITELESALAAEQDLNKRLRETMESERGKYTDAIGKLERDIEHLKHEVTTWPPKRA